MYKTTRALFTGKKIHDEQESANRWRFYHEALQSGASSRGVPHGGQRFSEIR